MDATWPLLLALVTAANEVETAVAVHLPTFKDLLAILAPRASDGDCTILAEGFTEEEQESFLKQHNEFRSIIATGKAEKFPKAAAMNFLEWNKALARKAQNTAQFCDPSRQGKEEDLKKTDEDYEGGTSQNTGSIFINKAEEAAQKGFAILQNWFKAREKFDVAGLDKYVKQADADVERFAQLIWAKSVRIGCGYVKFSLKSQPDADPEEILVCNYNPAGRVEGQPVYEKGEPCTKCEDRLCNEATQLCRNKFDETKERKLGGGESSGLLGIVGIAAAVIAVLVAMAGVCCMRSARRGASEAAEGAPFAGGAGDEGAAAQVGSKEMQKMEGNEGIGSQEGITKSTG
ncbi:scoloptoxin SSD43-like [Amblyomma americanum]